MSNQGKSVNEIAEIFGYEMRTIYRWFNHFELEGVEGLHDAEGRGRKATLREEVHSKSVHEYIKKLNLNEICAALKKEFSDSGINKRKIKHFFKKIGISYKRARKTIMQESKWQTYWHKIAQIRTVKAWVENGFGDLYFFDESGFSLDSNVPYRWSKVNEPTPIPANRFAKRINVLGFLNTKNSDQFYAMTTEVSKV